MLYYFWSYTNGCRRAIKPRVLSLSDSLWPCSGCDLLSPELSWSPTSGKDMGEVKLSISYKSDKLFIMVMHIRGLVSCFLLKCWFSPQWVCRLKCGFTPLWVSRWKVSRWKCVCVCVVPPLLPVPDTSSPSRTGRTRTPMWSSTCCRTPRRPARRRPRLHGAPATPPTTRWWANTTHGLGGGEGSCSQGPTRQRTSVTRGRSGRCIPQKMQGSTVGGRGIKISNNMEWEWTKCINISNMHRYHTNYKGDLISLHIVCV